MNITHSEKIFGISFGYLEKVGDHSTVELFKYGFPEKSHLVIKNIVKYYIQRLIKFSRGFQRN